MLQNAQQDILTGWVTSILFHLLARNPTIQKMEYKAKHTCSTKAIQQHQTHGSKQSCIQKFTVPLMVLHISG
jgi:hypothetical protein